MGNQQERSAFNKGWVVGIIDGEGSVLLTKKTLGYYPSIQIGNCNTGVIEKLTDILRFFELPFYICRATKTKANKDFQRIDIGGLKRLLHFFEVFPVELFEAKRSEIDLLSEYLKIRISKGENAPFGSDEDSIFHILKGYNGR